MHMTEVLLLPSINDTSMPRSCGSSHTRPMLFDHLEIEYVLIIVCGAWLSVFCRKPFIRKPGVIRLNPE